MKETSIYSYYRFGFNYNIWKGGFHNDSNLYVRETIQEYLEMITELELQVTAQIVNDLNEILMSLGNDDEIINDNDADKIKEIIDSADKTLDAELQLKKVLVVTPKRFNQEMLLVKPGRLLAKNSIDVLSINAKKDFSYATRCIAMNLPTASAFHLMRCVEEMVGQLYFYYVKQNRMKKLLWGPILKKLRDKNRPKPSKELLDHLDVLRDNFRNPTQHPEKFYTIDEAQDLLNSSIVAINMIASVLNNKSEK